MTTTAVYVSNADSGEISVLHLDPRRGALAPAQRVEVSGIVMPLALSPDRRCLYAARRAEPWAVLSFAIDPADGTLSPIGEAPLPQSMAYIVGPAKFAFVREASTTRPVAGAHVLDSMKTVAFKRRPARGHMADARLVGSALATTRPATGARKVAQGPDGRSHAAANAGCSQRHS